MRLTVSRWKFWSFQKRFRPPIPRIPTSFCADHPWASRCLTTRKSLNNAYISTRYEFRRKSFWGYEQGWITCHIASLDRGQSSNRRNKMDCAQIYGKYWSQFLSGPSNSGKGKTIIVVISQTNEETSKRMHLLNVIINNGASSSIDWPREWKRVEIKDFLGCAFGFTCLC